MPNSDYLCHAVVSTWLDARVWGYDQIANPRIDGLVSWSIDERRIIGYTLYGALDASYSKTGDRGIVGFEVSTEGVIKNAILGFPDITIKNADSGDYDRVEVFTEGKSGGDFTAKTSPNKAPCVGFVSLSKPKEGVEGDSIIELFDFSMNSAPAKTRLDSSKTRRIVVSSERRALELTRGDIDHIELVRTLQTDGKSYSRTVFYTQTETEGDRKINRLKSIYISPKAGVEDDIKFDVTYTDYDLNLPSTEFKAVTLGGSQYLYWLNTVSKDKVPQRR